MKFCPNCGNQIEENVNFCGECGSKIPQVPEETKIEYILPNPTVNYQLPNTPNQRRKGMKGLAIASFVLAGIYALMAISELIFLAMTSFMIIIGIMFWILSGTEQESKTFSIGKNTNGKPLYKKNFVIVCVFSAFVVFGVLTSILGIDGSTMPAAKNDTTKKSTTTEAIATEPAGPVLILDVTRFANVTSKELKELLGEPSSIDSSNYTGIITVPCKYYNYNNIEGLNEVEFLLINDKVVQLLTYTDLNYGQGKDLLAHVGIANPTNMTKAVDQSTDVRYRCPTESIDDVWIGLIDKEKDSFEFLRVTYDLFYSEEWYVPLSSDEQALYQTTTKETVKSILKSPKSADFPWLDWSFGKNPWYIAVQSYVDSQNSFGAEIRSEFTFIYSTTTGNLVYAVFDGEEVYNNGYVKYKDLVKKAATAK